MLHGLFLPAYLFNTNDSGKFMNVIGNKQHLCNLILKLHSPHAQTKSTASDRKLGGALKLD